MKLLSYGRNGRFHGLAASTAFVLKVLHRLQKACDVVDNTLGVGFNLSICWMADLLTIGSLGVVHEVDQGGADVLGSVEQHHLCLLVLRAETGGGSLDLLSQVLHVAE